MSIKQLLNVVCVSLFMALATTIPSYAADEVKEIRLYALDCGHIAFNDMRMFSDTGEFDGEPGEMIDACFLIRHPKGTLLWDAGLGDRLAKNEGGVRRNGIHMRVPTALVQQLQTLGLTSSDIDYLAFSHLHFDHTGNANLFTSATWILNRSELEWALSKPTPFGVNPGTFSAYKTVHKIMIDGDHDVFGDGSVRILVLPGHTPGSQALAVELEHTGTVILSGDLYHLRASRKHQLVPHINTSRAETLASMDRIERIIDNKGARLVIQHSPQDFESLPEFPRYLH